MFSILSFKQEENAEDLPHFVIEENTKVTVVAMVKVKTISSRENFQELEINYESSDKF